MPTIIRGTDNFDSSDNASQTELDVVDTKADDNTTAIGNIPTVDSQALATAWVNFNGVSGNVAIRDSLNISSVVRSATGIWTVYFETPMDNVNYVMQGTCGMYNYGSTARVIGISGSAGTGTPYSKTVNEVQVVCHGGGETDNEEISLTFYGGKA
jgi:hypothetical protein